MIDQDLTSTKSPSKPSDVSAGPSDPELLEGCRQGKRDAWDALFNKYYGVAARFVFQLSGDFSHEDTEEICQEAFLAVVRNIESFKGKSSFQTWLLRIAANKAMDYREKMRAAKRGGNVVHVSLDGAAEGDSPPTAMTSRSAAPDILLQNAEICQIVRQSLDRLGELCREVIELRYFGDLSYAEIADELQLNTKTVSSRLSKCLDRLQLIAKEILPPDSRFPSNL